MTLPLFEPTTVDVILLQGSRYRMRVDVTCDWESDLTGWTVKAQVRSSRAPGANVLQDLSSFGSIASPSNPMQVLLDIPADSSSAWTWDSGEYDVEVHHSSDPHRTLRVVQGHITINQEVTL